MNALHLSQAIDSQSDLSQAALALERQQVLLAEDCPDQGHLYLKFLQLAGAKVTLECNGQSAVDAVRKSPTLFDAVVMDFQMPEMDGIDATRQLREMGYHGVIIAVTAYGGRRLKESWFLAGCDEYPEKPLDKTKLIIAIMKHAVSAHKAIEV